MPEQSEREASNAKAIEVLFFENDLIQVDGIVARIKDMAKQLVADVPIEFQICRHCEEAMAALDKEFQRHARNEPAQFRAFLIDLMLPRDESGLSESKRIEHERSSILRQLVELIDLDALRLDEKILDLRRKKRSLEDDLERYINPDAGIEILEAYWERLKALERDNLVPLRIPVLFSSCRGAQAVKERCAKVVDPGFFAWLEKPTPPEDVARVLLRMLGFKAAEVRT